jgi:DNA-binding CsgD family transcriptional regulator
MMSAQIPAVLVVQNDGTVASQNRAARRLLGDKTGQYCWNVMGGLKGAEGLPCQRDCALKLLATGMDNSRHSSFRYGGQRAQLSCLPVDGKLVCALSQGAEESSVHWQPLTPRERAVLELLALGETTASAATCLDISEATVRTHVENMRGKLGVKTRAAIVASGFRRGYLA